ncbi:thioredoxin-like protein [Cantharellus anzutake]|uniref:thioredoxin-like protein n=1 Tax=Cantharellus anzutake TaxID=1750568 RepID=UPI0019078688|nr:thioredoxin-like protein [Cantharellus anzutake]KAF8342892.1 thioredoxin-like protein [Cantharellus anzutake]
MPDQLEELILSGELFNPSISESPPRTPTSRTPSPTTSDELFGPSPPVSRSPSPLPNHLPKDAPSESIGLGPGRTGVKGVIRDRNEALQLERERSQRRLRELRSRQEKSSLAYGGLTVLEEEKLRKKDRENRNSSEEEGEEEDEENEKRSYRGRNMKTYFEMRRATFEDARPVFGHLREVALSGFVKAVEKEDRDVWVLVHLYEPYEERCQTLDTTLAHLARKNLHTKFLRARAAHVGFAVKRSTHHSLPAGRSSHDMYDEYDELEGDNVEVDTELLPTLLVYRGGELEFTWVRVDLEAGPSGVGALLKRHGIVQSGDFEEDRLDSTLL